MKTTSDAPPPRNIAWEVFCGIAAIAALPLLIMGWPMLTLSILEGSSPEKCWHMGFATMEGGYTLWAMAIVGLFIALQLICIVLQKYVWRSASRRKGSLFFTFLSALCLMFIILLDGPWNLLNLLMSSGNLWWNFLYLLLIQGPTIAWAIFNFTRWSKPTSLTGSLTH